MAMQVRKLTADEAATFFPTRGLMDLSEYTQALRGLQPGDAGEVALAGLTSRALKRRLGQSAKQLGYTLRWADDTSNDKLRFLLRESRQGTPRQPRRGRPRKVAE